MLFPVSAIFDDEDLTGFGNLSGLAFTGRLVAQDPNDEPAEKLLERIRKEGQVEREQLSLL